MNLLVLDDRELSWLCGRLLMAEGFVVIQDSYSVPDIGVDFIVSPPGKNEKWAVELKSSRRRVVVGFDVRSALERLSKTKLNINASGTMLIVAREMTATAKSTLNLFKDVVVWDVRTLLEIFGRHPEVAKELDEFLEQKRRNVQRALSFGLPETKADELVRRLRGLPKGDGHWRNYEDLGIEILNYAFSPSLDSPRIQSRTEDGLDRRDAIYKINPGHAFWDMVRADFRTRMIVVEFKNLSEALGQKEVESIQQYLYVRAMRSFGILCGREEANGQAVKARRRAWEEFNKMVVILSDRELIELIQLKASDDEPSGVIEAQIDEFLGELAP